MGQESILPKPTAVGVKAEKRPGLHADGGNLYLRVSRTGAKSRIVRLTVPTETGPKRRDVGIGAVSALSLADARVKAAQLVAAARIEGRDPVAERRAERVAAEEAAAAVVKEAERVSLTFEAAARERHALLAGGWKNRKHTETWLSSLALHVFPVFGCKPLDKVTRDDVKAALLPIWTATPETGKQVRQRIADVFEWARAAKGFDKVNPTAGVKAGLPVVRKTAAHCPALAWREVPSFMADLEARDGISALCLRFAVLTAARSGEARGARWSEIDEELCVRSLPRERMKRDRPHRVPLSGAALAVVEAVRGLDPVFLFPSA